MLSSTVQRIVLGCDQSYRSLAHTFAPGSLVPSLISALVSLTEYTSYCVGSIPVQISGLLSEKSSSASFTRSGGSVVSTSISTLGMWRPPLYLPPTVSRPYRSISAGRGGWWTKGCAAR